MDEFLQCSRRAALKRAALSAASLVAVNAVAGAGSFFGSAASLARAADAASTSDAERTRLAALLAPTFLPPKEFAGDLGKFKPLLVFNDGTPVRTADDWQRRRSEILAFWRRSLGAWPDLIERPTLETLDSEHVDGIERRHVRVQIAPETKTEDAYLCVPAGEGPFPAALVVFYDAKTGVGLGTKPMLDFAWQLAKRGFVTLSLGSAPATYYPNKEKCQVQPLGYDAYIAANCRNALAGMKNVDAQRIGVLGHSYGGKWALFASCLYDTFACAAWSDPGVVFDEARGNVNYWEPWYLGYEPGHERKPGLVTADDPRTGLYKTLVETGHDLHELHALMARPRPFLVSGGSEDKVERWRALNHSVAVNKLLGFDQRVAMTSRPAHTPTTESNEVLFAFFEYFLKHAGLKKTGG